MESKFNTLSKTCYLALLLFLFTDLAMQGVSPDLKGLKKVVSNKIKTVDSKHYKYILFLFVKTYGIIEMLITNYQKRAETFFFKQDYQCHKQIFPPMES